jgi:hypothetical protein
VGVRYVIDVDVLEDFLIKADFEGGLPLVYYREEWRDDLQIAVAIDKREAEIEGS